MKRLVVLITGVLAIGCDDEPQFDCAETDGRSEIVFCDDFNDGEATSWTPTGGRFSVTGGRYVGEGPESLDGSACGVSKMTASMRDGTRSSDLVMHAEMRSLERVDKALVLRAQDPSNRIEVNFRADPLNDLVVQEIVGCELFYYTDEGEIALPHTMEDTLEIDVELRGDRLVVRREGEIVLDREFEFVSTEGEVGVAVIDRSVTEFDSVWLERL